MFNLRDPKVQNLLRFSILALTYRYVSELLIEQAIWTADYPEVPIFGEMSHMAIMQRMPDDDYRMDLATLGVPKSYIPQLGGVSSITVGS